MLNSMKLWKTGLNSTNLSLVRLIVLFPLASVVFTFSCGYHVENGSPALAPGKTLAIESFENLTTYYKVDQIFTKAMINEMVRSTGYKIVSNSTGADAILKSTIRGLNTSPVTFSKSSFASTFLVTINAKVQLIEKSSGKILYENHNVLFSEQYVINTDVENFFSEMNPAMSRLAEDFSSTIVAAILEAF